MVPGKISLYFLKFFVLFFLMNFVRGFSLRCGYKWRSIRSPPYRFASTAQNIDLMPAAGSQHDCLLNGVSFDGGVVVRAVSCRDTLQTMIAKLKISSDIIAQTLGEVAVCAALLAASLKGEETLQLVFVGAGGVRHVMVLADSNLNLRGSLGVANHTPDSTGAYKGVLGLFSGVGQVQVVRNHPFWKQPMSGVVEMTDSTVCANVAQYLGLSEQHLQHLRTEVRVVGGRVQTAEGMLLQSLPGVSTDAFTSARDALQALPSLLLTSSHVDAETAVRELVSQCVPRREVDQYCNRSVQFLCRCSKSKAVQALRLLLQQNNQEQGIATEDTTQIKCEFCGEEYVVTSEDVKAESV